MYNIYILYNVYIYIYIYISNNLQFILFLVSVTYLGYRHNNNCFSDLPEILPSAIVLTPARPIGTYRPTGDISWYRLKVKLILY